MINEENLDQMIDETNDALHKLMEWGFVISYIEDFVKDNPKEVLITKKGNPGMKLFTYYLDKCSKKELVEIQSNHLARAQILQLNEAQSREIIGEQPVKSKEEMRVADYIEELAKTRKIVEEQSIVLLEQKQTIGQLQSQYNELKALSTNLVNSVEVIEKNTKEHEYLIYLYNLMGEKMIFRTELPSIYNRLVERNNEMDAEFPEDVFKEIVLTPYLKDVNFNLTDEDIQTITEIKAEVERQ